MFAHDFVHLDRPPDALQAEAASAYCPWLLALGRSDAAAADRRPAPVAGPVTVGLPAVRGLAVVVPLQWSVVAGDGAVLAVEGWLDIGPLSATSTRLELSCRYDLPGGVGLRAGRGLRLHGLVEASARAVLGQLTSELERHHAPLA